MAGACARSTGFFARHISQLRLSDKYILRSCPAFLQHTRVWPAAAHLSQSQRYKSYQVYQGRSLPLGNEQNASFSTALPDLQRDDDFSKDIAERVNLQLSQQDIGRLFAVVFVAGKQRKVTQEDVIVLDKHIDAEIGERIRLNKVMMVGGRDFTLVGRPVLHSNTARVEATVIEKTLEYTKILYKYKRRKNKKKFKLSQSPQTFLVINNIRLSQLED